MELSIGVIVVLILAIVMLGLGIVFTKNIFGSTTQNFEQVSGEAKKQMIDQMKDDAKIVDLSRQKIEIKVGETKQIYIGFSNKESEAVDFTISSSSKATAIASGTPENSCGFNTGTEKILLGYKIAPTNVIKGDTVILPMNIKADSGAAKGELCFYEILVNYGTSGSAKIELTVDVI